MPVKDTYTEKDNCSLPEKVLISENISQCSHPSDPSIDQNIIDESESDIFRLSETYFLANISENGDLLNTNLPVFTGYVNGKSVKILADSGCQKTVIKTSSFPEYFEKISECNLSFKAANSIGLKVDGEIDNLKIKIFNNFCLDFKNVPMLSNLPFDILIGYPDLQKIGFSLPKNNDTYFTLGDFKIKINQNDYRIVRTKNFKKIGPNFENILSITNPYFGLTDASELLITPLSKLQKNNRLGINSAIVKNTKKIPLIISTDRSNPFSVPKNVPIAKIEPINQNIKINFLAETENFQNELDSCKIFQAERSKKFKITPEKIPDIKEIGPLETEKINILNEILKSGNRAFSHDKNDLGQIHGWQFRINLKNENKIAYRPPRILPPGIRDKAEAEFENWRSKGMVEESTSEHNSPILIIQKGEEKKSTRLVIDSRFE